MALFDVGSGSARLSTRLATERLALEPAVVSHAAAFAEVFRDPALHAHIGGAPRSVDEWSAQLEKWARRLSPDGSEAWLNWAVVLPESGQVVGWVQATVTGTAASVAFVVGADWQGRGYATEATRAVIDHLLACGVTDIGASISPANSASRAVAGRLGLVNQGTTDEDGEERYALPQ